MIEPKQRAPFGPSVRPSSRRGLMAEGIPRRACWSEAEIYPPLEDPVAGAAGLASESEIRQNSLTEGDSLSAAADCRVLFNVHISPTSPSPHISLMAQISVMQQGVRSPLLAQKCCRPRNDKLGFRSFSSVRFD